MAIPLTPAAIVPALAYGARIGAAGSGRPHLSMNNPFSND